MPLYAEAELRVRANLLAIMAGDRPPLVAIGTLSQKQWDDINAVRRGLHLHELGSPEVLYLGKHHYQSRQLDGYSLDDMWFQVASAMRLASVVIASPRMTTMQNPMERADGYGNMVKDLAVFELTQRKPRAELLSVIPKGDRLKP